MLRRNVDNKFNYTYLHNNVTYMTVPAMNDCTVRIVWQLTKQL